ncbi:TetR/AcrR family transcriptional regulator [Actinoplanes sp. HUAS TT8]|uniref:TetR/AcrR family transcriptional regulator n=1 Tax=Actinoplanes sp. HUAS TT8 TaxID=3447453 RepID=UPI003F52667D
MGNREALIEGAKQCLTERGWARTTVRDIATAAGVNHAAIGYHFGSRESLLIHALVEAVEELSATVAERSQGHSHQERWQSLIDTFDTHRPLWMAQLEAAVQAEHSPELRERLADALRQSRQGLGGSVPLAVLSGLMIQWLIDPDEAPDGAQVVVELHAQAEEG